MTEGKKIYLAAAFIILLALLFSIFFILYFSGQPQGLSQGTQTGLLVLGGNDGGHNDTVSLITGYKNQSTNILTCSRHHSQIKESVEVTACPASRLAEQGVWRAWSTQASSSSTAEALTTTTRCGEKLY